MGAILETGHHRVLEGDREEDIKRDGLISQRPTERVPEEKCLIVFKTTVRTSS